MLETSKNPENVESIIADLRERESHRRRAIDLAVQHYDEAQTEDDRNSAAKDIVVMMDVLEEFSKQFPEVFPEPGENG